MTYFQNPFTEPDGLPDRLIGALVGLARPTDGNEHLICPSATNVLIEGLRALAASDRNAMASLLPQATEEKRKMVPDCFACASPCGKNSNYDMALFRAEPEDLRTRKLQLLHRAEALASCVQSPAATGFLYKALILFGMDCWEAEDLLPFLEEGDELLSKAAATRSPG